MHYLKRNLLGTVVSSALLISGVSGDIILVDSDITQNTTWTSDNEYILTDIIFVQDGAELTIEPGTIIRGEQKGSGSFDPGTLVITKGSTIMADGTSSDPIIFASAAIDNDGDGVPDLGADLDGDGTPDFKDWEAGDTFLDADPKNDPIGAEFRGLWGGLIVLGDATTNVNRSDLPENQNFVEGLPDPNAGGDTRGVYGGNNDEDSSGVLRWISIRNGGSNLASDNEINGLTMGGVGRGTTIEYIEVFANLDDGFEWFGGTVNTSNLVSAFNDDDTFDMDEGFRGLHQFWFSIIGAGNSNGEHGGEHDGGTDPQDGEPFTNPTIANVTYIGAGAEGGGQDDSGGFQLRDNYSGTYINSIFTEFVDDAIEIESDGDTPARLQEGSIVFDNNIWWNFSLNEGTGEYDNTPAGFSSDAGEDVSGFWDGTQAFPGENFDNEIADPALIGISRQPDGGLDPRPAMSSPAVSGAGTVPDNGFHEQTTFRGAFGADNWAKGWTVLDRLGYFPASDESTAEDNELSGISTRGLVGAGEFENVLNSSVIILGTDPMDVVFRARSTSINLEGVDLLPDPIIDVVRVGEGVIATNDSFAEADNLDLLTGTQFDPETVGMNPEEALLILLDLEPGAYSVRVRSAVEGETGLAIAEAFAVR